MFDLVTLNPGNVLMILTILGLTVAALTMAK